MWKRTVVRAVMVALVAALVSTGEAAVARPVPVGAGAAASQPPPSEEDQASAQAKATGSRVEVVGDRAETRQVFAEPDGTFTMQLSAPPARARKTTGWTGVDTTLRRRPDGRLEPTAAPGTLTLSGGGLNPLIQLGDRDKRVELSWPDRLPAPALSGDTATYADVIPGVDLKVTAGAQGFSERLVVKSRQAAADPRLDSLRFGLKTSAGLTAAADPNGGMSVKDGGGGVVFASPGAGMWDTPPPPPPAVNADDITETQVQGDHQAQGAVAVSSGTVTVTPDQSLLDDPDAIYPISIDPDFQAPGAGWTKVFSGYPGNAYWFGGGDDGSAKVGYCGWSGCGGIAAARSFFQFDITALRGAQILPGTEFDVHETRAPSCSPSTFEVYQTDPVGPWTTWNSQPGNWAGLASRTVAHGYSSACPPASEGFDVRQSVTDKLNAGATVATFALKGTGWWDTGGERDRFQWKKFDSGTLIVRYNWPPNAPNPVWSNVDQGPSQGCAVQPNEPYAYSPTPTLHAIVTDPDGQNVQANFQWFTRFGAEVGETSTAFLPNGSPFAVTIPSGSFKDQARIAWRVRGGDGITWGPWSRWCDITVDSTPPGRLAQVSSADYPYGSHSSGYVGKTGAFSVTSDDPDVIGFQWALNNPSLPPVDLSSPFFAPVTVRDASTGQAGATIRATPTLEGPNSLYVRAVDRALNVSPTWDRPDGHGGYIAGGYTFTVSAAVPDPVGYWPLDGFVSRTNAPDVTGRGHDGTVSGMWPAAGAAWAVGRVGDALRFDGATGSMATGGPIVNTANTYTVAAWVKLDAADSGWRVAVSQDGAHKSGFALEYRPDNQRWNFLIGLADDDSNNWIRADSSTPAQAGVWTHLLGSFDSGTGQLRLYVNGALSGTAQVPSGTAIQNIQGGIVVGRGKQAGNCCSWLGSVDEVKVWDRLLADSEIQREADGSLVEEAFYPLDEGSGRTANDGSGNYRTGTLSSGVTWLPGLVGAGAVRIPSGETIATALPAVRTDGSFTVTARAYLDAADGAFQTVVAQDGPQSSGFALQYDPGSHAWMFVVSPQDAANPAWMVARATSAVTTPQQWTHLAGVYDAGSGEIRLYVDGAEFKTSGRVAANVAGGVTIGRAKQNGAGVAYFAGRVDDVHLYTGAMTRKDVDADHLNPVVARPNFHVGELERYFDNNGRHFTTSGLVPHEQHPEGSLGLLAPAGASNTRTIYSCMYGSGQFVSLQADCEGYTMLGTIGQLYTTPPAGVPTIAIYRCLVPSTGDHFDSTDANCEGGWRNEGLQGYTRLYRNLVRSVRTYLASGPQDTLVNTWPIVSGAGYREESLLGIVAASGEAGTWGLEACSVTVTTSARGQGTDEFISHDTGCEGSSAQGLGWIGNTWNDPPPYAQESAVLYSCRADDTGDRFASLDEFCEGQTVLGSFGYVITRF